MTKFAAALALTGLLCMTSPLPALAQTAAGPAGADQVTTLDLSAFGEVKTAPDQATITLGVQSKAITAADAMRQNAQQMSRVIAALRQAGVGEKSIQTSNLSLDAQYAYDPNQPPRLTGYQASNDVLITVDDLTKLGSILDAAVASGANQVNGISFGLKDAEASEAAARLAAVKALRAKADLYAGATGYHVTRLISLSEGGGYAPGPIRPMMAMARLASAPETPVSPGELTVRVDVSGSYALGR